MMSNLLHVSSSPHIRSKITTDWIMYMVLIALLPATCMGVYLFGVPALILIVCSVVTCVATEYIYERLMHKPITIKDGSAMVTGLLLALNLPSGAAWWMAVLGGVFAILVVKQLFGGLGQNIMNPALAARCFLMISFAARMTDFSTSDSVTAKLVDTVSGAFPVRGAVREEGCYGSEWRPRKRIIPLPCAGCKYTFFLGGEMSP